MDGPVRVVKLTGEIAVQIWIPRLSKQCVIDGTRSALFGAQRLGLGLRRRRRQIRQWSLRRSWLWCGHRRFESTVSSDNRRSLHVSSRKRFLRRRRRKIRWQPWIRHVEWQLGKDGDRERAPPRRNQVVNLQRRLTKEEEKCTRENGGRKVADGQEVLKVAAKSASQQLSARAIRGLRLHCKASNFG